MSNRHQVQGVCEAREIGDYWEEQFEGLAEQYNWSCTRSQKHIKNGAAGGYDKKGKFQPGPDTRLDHRSNGGRQQHEIKHKNPTKAGYIGYEKYRWEAMLWHLRQSASLLYYTLHRWDLTPSGDRNDRSEEAGKIQYWQTIDVRELQKITPHSQSPGGGFPFYEGRGPTLRDGCWIEVDMCYWHASFWRPLAELWLPSSQLAHS